jgi:hypothetical protein
VIVNYGYTDKTVKDAVKYYKIKMNLRTGGRKKNGNNKSKQCKIEKKKKETMLKGF